MPTPAGVLRSWTRCVAVAGVLLAAGGCTGARPQPTHPLAIHTHLEPTAFGAEVRDDPESTSPWGGVVATVAIIGIDAVMMPVQIAFPGGRRDVDHVLAVGLPLSTHVMLVVSRGGQEVHRIPVTWGDHRWQEPVPSGDLDVRLELVSPCLRRMVDLPAIHAHQASVDVDVVAALRTQPESITSW